MGLRHRSIRLRVGILIIVPVLCLLGLYAFAASITLGNAVAAARAKSIRTDVANPVGAFQLQLAAERHLALLLVANPTSSAAQTAFGIQENKTQNALNALALAMAAKKVTGSASPYEKQAIARLLTDAKRLSYMRGDVTNGAYSLPTALAAYDSIMNAGYTVLDEAIDQETDVPLVTQALHVINLDRALQTALAENDLLAAEMAQGKFPYADRAAFAGLASERQSLLSTAMPELQPPYQTLVAAALTPALSNSVTAAEARVLSTPWHAGVPASVAYVPTTFMTYTKALGTSLAVAAVELQNQAQHQANTIYLQLILAGGLGLIGIIASIALSLVIGRGLVRQLRRLRQSALSLALDKLPDVISQLRAGQPVDVTEYETGDISTSNEIEQVQHAFGVVQQTAVQSAIDEARLRRGISDVFRNLAGRSQSLLHRQLTLLDGMERRATEPDELEDLFRIDHLTTRMRRHAEGLIILSGETPARGWRQPVPLVDVLRAAVAEVEDYTRVRVLSRTSAAVAGHAVADIIHLIAELAENATVFSPPNTPVRIQGDIVGRGFAVEIEDRGLGISPQRLAEINANLANPPQFDLSGSDRLGLFIAGQLAHRHEIKVTLRPSVYGGTTAIVLIPTALVVDGDSYEQDPALTSGQPASAQSGRLAGRHAAIEHATSRNGAGRATAEVDPDYAGTSLAIGSTADLLDPADSAEPVRADLADPAANGVPEPGGFATPGASSWAPSEPSRWGEGEPSGFGAPGPTGFGASEQGAWAAGEPSGFGAREQGAWAAGEPSGFGAREQGAWAAGEPSEFGAREQGAFVAGEPSGFVAGEQGSFAMPDPSAFGPASAGQPDPAADGALEPGRFGAPDPSGFGTPEPKDNGLPTRTVTGLPVSDGDPRVTAAELTDQGLPVRVRQASLAPQLRNSSPPRPPSFIPSGLRPVASPSGLSPSAASPTGDSSEDIDSDGTGGAGTPPPRGIDVFAAANRLADPAVSPEAARNTVSALQRGWQLGRAEAAEATSPGQSAGESAGDSDNAGPDQDFDSDERRTD